MNKFTIKFWCQSTNSELGTFESPILHWIFSFPFVEGNHPLNSSRAHICIFRANQDRVAHSITQLFKLIFIYLFFPFFVNYYFFWNGRFIYFFFLLWISKSTNMPGSESNSWFAWIWAMLLPLEKRTQVILYQSEKLCKIVY